MTALLLLLAGLNGLELLAVRRELNKLRDDIRHLNHKVSP